MLGKWLYWTTIMTEYFRQILIHNVGINSLMATNAARYRMVAGKNIKLLEFGLRRAQGPDGGLSASKYSYIGEYPSHVFKIFFKVINHYQWGFSHYFQFHGAFVLLVYTL